MYYGAFLKGIDCRGSFNEGIGVSFLRIHCVKPFEHDECTRVCVCTYACVELGTEIMWFVGSSGSFS